MNAAVIRSLKEIPISMIIRTPYFRNTDDLKLKLKVVKKLTKLSKFFFKLTIFT